MIILRICFLSLYIFSLGSCNQRGGAAEETDSANSISLENIRNPFIPGYYAEPSIINHGGKYYIYSSIDPWGSFELAVWESADFQNWTLRRLNWPTIIRCTSKSSDNSMVSSPSVVKGHDGKFYMYVSSGGEIWAGTSDHPLGPWYNLLPENTPLISKQEGNKIRSTGAECFIDDDGQAYLYWGSGINWENGGCKAGKLGKDMCSFVGEPQEITPPNYFDAPFVLKYNNQYIMLYSQGRCNDSTYKIRYAISEYPLGPWTEGVNSPILKSSISGNLIGPGHAVVYTEYGKHYLLYQAISESVGYNLLRQIYIGSLALDSMVILTSPEESNVGKLRKQIFEVSSQLSDLYPASAAIDQHFGSLWVADNDDTSPHIVIDLKSKQNIETVYLWLEYSFAVYQYLIEYSSDAIRWSEYADAYNSQDRGGPRFHTKFVKARYIRITFSKGGITECRPAIWEIVIE